MTTEQRKARALMMGYNVRPIHIRPMTDNEDVDWFRYHVARASGRLGEYWKPRMRWYFHCQLPAKAPTQDGPAISVHYEMFIFRTFREACDKVREIFKECS